LWFLYLRFFCNLNCIRFDNSILKTSNTDPTLLRPTGAKSKNLFNDMDTSWILTQTTYSMFYFFIFSIHILIYYLYNLCRLSDLSITVFHDFYKTKFCRLVFLRSFVQIEFSRFYIAYEILLSFQLKWQGVTGPENRYFSIGLEKSIYCQKIENILPFTIMFLPMLISRWSFLGEAEFLNFCFASSQRTESFCNSMAKIFSLKVCRLTFTYSFAVSSLIVRSFR